MDRASIIQTARDVLHTCDNDISAAYLFGSMARGTAGARSDVDIAVLFRRDPEPGLSGMGFDLAFALELRLRRAVDIIVLNHCSPDLVHRVLRDGVLLSENDRRARVDFEVRMRAQYFDLAPLRNIYRNRKTNT